MRKKGKYVTVTRIGGSRTSLRIVRLAAVEKAVEREQRHGKNPGASMKELKLISQLQRQLCGWLLGLTVCQQHLCTRAKDLTCIQQMEEVFTANSDKLNLYFKPCIFL